MAEFTTVLLNLLRILHNDWKHETSAIFRTGTWKQIMKYLIKYFKELQISNEKKHLLSVIDLENNQFGIFAIFQWKSKASAIFINSVGHEIPDAVISLLSCNGINIKVINGICQQTKTCQEAAFQAVNLLENILEVLREPERAFNDMISNITNLTIHSTSQPTKPSDQLEQLYEQFTVKSDMLEKHAKNIEQSLYKILLLEVSKGTTILVVLLSISSEHVHSIYICPAPQSPNVRDLLIKCNISNDFVELEHLPDKFVTTVNAVRLEKRLSNQKNLLAINMKLLNIENQLSQTEFMKRINKISVGRDQIWSIVSKKLNYCLKLVEQHTPEKNSRTRMQIYLYYS